MSDATLLNLDDILSQSIDGVKDAPDFVSPPDGSYVLLIAKCVLESYKTKNKETQEEEDRKRIKLFYSVKKTVELVKASEDKVPDGSMFTESFMINDDGLSYFKRQAKHSLGAETIAGSTLGEILTELNKGTHEVNAVVNIKETNGTNATGQATTFKNVQVRIKPVDAAAE